ncbi:hypothetical protein V865_001163 [Kwoniella europaea PYCC6329]|uniref:Long chronological lifespan protein 2 n=1 Tax=Kwoniella europaea PYCC6329 TaxID=1423913 RepID=A0AAX4K9D3_9TREE
MLFIKFSSIVVLGLASLAIAAPAPVAGNDALQGRDIVGAIDKRQEIHCAYHQVCYCARTRVRFTCQDVNGCELDCPTGPIIPKA